MATIPSSCDIIGLENRAGVFLLLILIKTGWSFFNLLFYTVTVYDSANPISLKNVMGGGGSMSFFFRENTKHDAVIHRIKKIKNI